MNSTVPSSWAFAQTGWKRGSEKSSPSTLAPTAAPRRPCRFTACSSCSTARSGYCKASEAKAAKRSGREAHNSASFSFCTLTIAAAVSRSLRYQNGLMESTSMSMTWASMPLRRSSMTMKCSCAPLVCGKTDFSFLAHQIDGLMEMTVRVDIDGLDALAVDHDRQGARMEGTHARPGQCNDRVGMGR